MNEEIRRALDIAPNAPARERTIDITTSGARSGAPRRIETWLHHVDGRWFLSGRPGTRDWYANVRANPRLTVHLKRGVQADLPATGRTVIDPEERRSVLSLILGGLAGMTDGNAAAHDLDAWVADSPLVELTFDGS